MKKKGMGSIVATSLLIVVTVIAVISYQTWFGSYSSNILVEVEKSSSQSAKVGIEALIDNNLYLKNLESENVSINQIIIENKNCNLSKNISSGISKIDITECLDNLTLTDSIAEITIVTDTNIITKKYLFKDLNISSTSSQSLEENSENWFGDGSDGDILVNDSGVYQSFDDGVSYSLVPESTGKLWNSVQDGDMVVINAKDFVVESGVTFSTTNRCRGLMIYSSGNITINGTISMTAKGAHTNPADSVVTSDTPVAPSDGNPVPNEGLVIRRSKSDWSDIDNTIITNAHANNVGDFNGTHNSSDLFYGTGTDAVNSELNQKEVIDGLVIKIPKIGGSGGARQTAHADGFSGNSNLFSSGGGGSGAATNGAISGEGVSGTCFSGGNAGGGSTPDVYSAPPVTALYGGQGGIGRGCRLSGEYSSGGGAGNDGGTTDCSTSFFGNNGTGGLLIISTQNSLNGEGSIESKGSQGGEGRTAGGGGSGGGIIILTYVKTFSDQLTINTSGGLGGLGITGATEYEHGGPGGEGSIIGPIQIDN